MAYPEPTEVAPWYLRNITQALALDSATGNVYVRTGITGNVVITGPVTIPGTVTVNSSAADPVHVHLDEVGTSGILDVPYLPIGGNVAIPTGVSVFGNVNANVLGNVAVEGNVGILGNVTVTQGTNPWTVTGNVRSSVTGNVTVVGNVTIGNFPSVQSITGDVTGNVSILGNVTIGNFPAIQSITGNVNALVTGNVSIIGNVSVIGNVNASILGNVNASILGNVTVGNFPSVQSITGNVNASVTGNVGIVGDVNVTQGTNPWSIAGNVNASILGNVTASIVGNVTTSVVGNVNVTQGTNPWITTPALGVGDFYGEPYAIQITPVVQLDGRYGLVSADVQTYTAGGGTANTANSALYTSSTSTVGSYGLLRSRRFNTYKPGQSLLARWYGKFDTPVTGTSQRMGLNNQENAYWFGYNNTTFGFLHTWGGRAPIYTVTLNSYTGTQTVTLTLNSVTYTASILTGETVNEAAQRLSQINFGGTWLANQKDNTLQLLASSVGAMGGTFSITSSGNLSATITQTQAGAAATNEWFYNGVDFTLPDWLDPTYYNQWQLKYSWAGVNLFALNPNTGFYTLIYQHLQTDEATLELINPAFKVSMLALNTGASTAVTVRCASMMMGLEGITNRNNYSAAQATTKTSLTQNVLHHLLSIQNPYTFNGTINTKEFLLQDFTVTMQCNDPTEVYVYLDAPLTTGVQNFISQNGYPSTVSFASGTINEATNYPILSFVVGNTGSSVQFPLEAYRVVIPPGSTMSIACVSTATIQKAAAALVWYND